MATINGTFNSLIGGTISSTVSTPGPQGLPGPTGPTGSQGPIGHQGVQGPQGIQGVKGDKGDTGSTGATGANGPQGIQGPAGPTGPQGIQGIQGINGDKYATTSTSTLTIGNGSKTITVSAGLAYTVQQSVIIAYDNDNHMHGDVTSYNSGTGVIVIDVKNHTGAGTYASWTVNLEGAAGIQGPQGIQGSAGSTGPAGATGPAGPAGPDGATGATGPQGPQGIQGETGPQGIQGIQGNTGPAGEGVPTGGNAGEILSKVDGTDYNTTWVPAPTIPNNSSQIFTTVHEDSSASVYANTTTLRNTIVKLTNAGDVSVYLGSGFSDGDQILFVNLIGGASVNFIADSGNTVYSPSGNYLVGVGGVVAAVYIGSSTWIISGKLQATA